MFINDILFQVNNTSGAIGTLQKSIRFNGKIISVTLPNTIKNLKNKLPIFIAPNQHNKDDGNDCGYWNYTNATDGWSADGCIRNKLLSTSTHLTHFAYLFQGYIIIPSNQLNNLKIITIVGCSFSLTGILFIYVTAILFEKWRSSCSTKILLHFSTAIVFEMAMVLFVDTEENTKTFALRNDGLSCIAVGSLTHYFLLVTFLWMLISY